MMLMYIDIKIIEHSVQAGLLGVCLGERRRLAVEDRSLWNKFADILPDIMEEIQTFLDVEVTGINAATWRVFSSGLKVALLEPVAAERCTRTVTTGDTLSVEYSGGSSLEPQSKDLEDFTITEKPLLSTVFSKSSRTFV